MGYFVGGPAQHKNQPINGEAIGAFRTVSYTNTHTPHTHTPHTSTHTHHTQVHTHTHTHGASLEKVGGEGEGNTPLHWSS